MKKAVIAMSGGVDSSVAALLMKQAGADCTGIMLKLYAGEETGTRTCCSLEDSEDARAVADRLGMPFYMLNFTEAFEEKVIDSFVCAYKNGRTPNPCIECNRYIKFDMLLQRAAAMDFDILATGHYARISRDESTGRYLLKKSLDESKDQSYMLCSLTQEQLAKTAFPLGELSKSEVRRIAGEYGLINARKRDSQDICFVPNGDYAEFIESYTKKTFPPGGFVGSGGQIYGTHRGIIHYTVGQRKGLGLSFSEPMYVGGIDADKNEVLLVKHEELFSKTLYADRVNFISVQKLDKPMRVSAKIRYRHSPQLAEAVMTENGLKVSFDEPQRAVTPGQAVVLYDGDVVVGGGEIRGSEPGAQDKCTDS